MKLDRLVLVNWGQLRPGNFEMGDMTLLTGETGSGKSTMLDALQTVMTAANKGIMNYNPGQDEVTQGQRRGKTKRTLESYVVGAEYNNFSRKDGAQGFMAAVFRPSKGEEHPHPAADECSTQEFEVWCGQLQYRLVMVSAMATLSPFSWRPTPVPAPAWPQSWAPATSSATARESLPPGCARARRSHALEVRSMRC